MCYPMQYITSIVILDSKRCSKAHLCWWPQAGLEAKVDKTRERLERIARRLSPGSEISPSPLQSPYGSPDRTLVSTNGVVLGRVCMVVQCHVLRRRVEDVDFF